MRNHFVYVMLIYYLYNSYTFLLFIPIIPMIKDRILAAAHDALNERI